MSVLLQVFLFSMTPFGELRLGIPIGLTQGANPFLVYLTGVAGNMLIVPVMFFFLEYIHSHFLHVRAYRTLFDRYMDRVRRKTIGKVEKYGLLGLALFVAIPLPVTGAYTGTLAAWFFGMDRRKAFMSITGGIVIAGLIVMSIMLLGISTLEFLVKA